MDKPIFKEFERIGEKLCVKFHLLKAEYVNITFRLFMKEKNSEDLIPYDNYLIQHNETYESSYITSNFTFEKPITPDTEYEVRFVIKKDNFEKVEGKFENKFTYSVFPGI